MENECEVSPGVAYPGVRDNRSTINTKTGYDDDDDDKVTTPHNQPDIVIVSVYRPPNNDTTIASDIMDSIKSLMAKYRKATFWIQFA